MRGKIILITSIVSFQIRQSNWIRQKRFHFDAEGRNFLKSHENLIESQTEGLVFDKKNNIKTRYTESLAGRDSRSSRRISRFTSRL